MGHINFKEKQTGVRNTDPEWFPISSMIGRLANKWAGREDLIAFVGEGAGSGSPACFKPGTAEVEVDLEVAFCKGVTPDMIGDLTQRSNMYEWPKAIGAIMHEAFHAKHSLWDIEKMLKDLTPDEVQAMVLLEEGRIESLGMSAVPYARPFLRACAMDIVLAGAAENFRSQTIDVANMVALIHARIDAGVLDSIEVAEVKGMIDDYLGEDTINALRDVAARAQAHTDDSDEMPLYALAREWVSIVKAAAEEKGDAGDYGDPDAASAGKGVGGAIASFEGMGSDGEESEPMSGEAKTFMEALKDAIEEAKDAVEVANYDDLLEQEDAEERAEEAKERADASQERKKFIDTAKRIFSKSTGEAGSGTTSYLMETRKPKSEERIAAVKIAGLLEKAKYRERDAVEIKSVLPPGRLRTRALVQGAAAKSRGIVSDTEAWRRTVRKQTDDPTLTVGVMVDISGSMSAAMKPMATTAWVMSEAVKRVQGKCAMVYFGNSVFPTLKPGETLSDVRTYYAGDSTEKFNTAFEALNGSLNLLDGTGARMLVVVSDGQYTPDETKASRKWVQRCQQAGVAVLWLPFDGGHSLRDLEAASNVAIVKDTYDTTAAASAIGQAAARILSKVGQG